MIVNAPPGLAFVAVSVVFACIVSAANKQLTPDDTIGDLVKHPAFAGFSHLLLPCDNRAPDDSVRLRNIGSLLPYHSHVDPPTVVGALNHMVTDVDNGKTVFHEFYTPAQKKQDPTKSNTGLFFFRGKPGAPFAIIAPGEASRMSHPSMKAFHMLSRSAKGDTTRSS